MVYKDQIGLLVVSLSFYFFNRIIGVRFSPITRKIYNLIIFLQENSLYYKKYLYLLLYELNN